VENFLTNILFPKFCFGCEREGNFLCQDCRHLLGILEWDYCLCSKGPHSLPGRIFLDKINNGKCKNCSSKKLAGLYFAVPFGSPVVKKMIHQFKYGHLKSLAEPLASLLIEHFTLAKTNKEEIWADSVLMPVPLHIKKQKDRGYNQSEELAKELSKVLKIPVISDMLTKIKNTESQMKLKKEAREENLINAFKISGGMSDIPPLAKFKKIFLVDDVYTTGSTMEECAKILKKAGVKSVWGIAIAREE
jgi:ComF family protein